MKNHPYIDIHTHAVRPNTAERFSLPNVIVGKDEMPSQPCSLGIHPWHMAQNIPEREDLLRERAGRADVWAIGECGLDRLRGGDAETQERLFRMQIRLADELGKPIIIHCARAHQDCLRILREEKVRTPVVFHGFDKSAELARQIRRDGHCISLGASLLTGRRDELARDFPPDGIFLETDDKPIAIADVYAYFCRVRKMELGLLKERLHENFMRIFNHRIGA